MHYCHRKRTLHRKRTTLRIGAGGRYNAESVYTRKTSGEKVERRNWPTQGLSNQWNASFVFCSDCGRDEESPDQREGREGEGEEDLCQDVCMNLTPSTAWRCLNFTPSCVERWSSPLHLRGGVWTSPLHLRGGVWTSPLHLRGVVETSTLHLCGEVKLTSSPVEESDLVCTCGA